LGHDAEEKNNAKERDGERKKPVRLLLLWLSLIYYDIVQKFLWNWLAAWRYDEAKKKSIAKASGKPNLLFDVLCRAEIFLQLFQR